MHRILSALIALSFVGTGAAFAQSDAIAQRKQSMKDVGAATRDPGQMLQGRQPFDLAKVKASLQVYVDSAQKMPGLYPPGTEQGGDTSASAKVWQSKADFDARFAQWGSASRAALTAITDEASFKAEFPKIMQACGACHEVYREKK